MIPIVYVFNHNALLEADEMALATLEGLRDEFQPFVFAPDGALLNTARHRGMFAIPFSNTSDFVFRLALLLVSNEEIAYVATSRKNSKVMRALNLLFQRRTTHLQVVDERDATDARIRDIGLDRDDVIFVTRSDSVRERLSTKLMRQDRIRVVEGFLSPARIASLHPRAPFDESGVRRVLVSCPDGDAEAIRLFLGALKDDSAPPFLNYLIRAESDQRDEIREMLRDEPGVSLIPGRIATAGVVASCDLLLRLGDSDFVDFITLEALATGVPVLTAAFESRTSPISDGANGFCYRSGDSADLAAQLRRLASISFDQLNAVAKGGRYLVDIRYSADSGVERFKRLFGHSRAPVPEFNGGKLIL